MEREKSAVGEKPFTSISIRQEGKGKNVNKQSF